MLLELEAAHLYLIMVLEGIKSLPVSKYQPQSYDDFFAIEGYLLRRIMSSIEDKNDDPLIPTIAEMTLSNFPNPFNPNTTISFSLPRESNVNLSIYNIRGQKVKTLLNAKMTDGPHSVVWHGTDACGSSVGSGIYFYRLETEGFSKTSKMVLLK
jgi:hypothetical protein